jgi:hypothetical protein
VDGEVAVERIQGSGRSTEILSSRRRGTEAQKEYNTKSAKNAKGRAVTRYRLQVTGQKIAENLTLDT